MIRFGVITNPGSLRNRTDPAVRRALEERPDVPRFVFTGREDIGLGVAGLAAQGVSDLVIDGGDGTVVAAMSAAICAGGFQRPPRFAVIPSGTTNLIAAQMGIGGPRATAMARLLSLSQEAAEAHTIRCSPLRIERAALPTLHGFLMGAAAFHRGTLMSHRDMQRLGFARKAIAGLGVLTNMWRVLFGAERQSLLAGDPIRTDADGIALPGDRRFLFLATTLDRLVLKLNPFWGGGAGAIRWLDIAAPPQSLLAALPRVLLGRPSAWMETAGYRSGRAHRLTLRTRSPFILDGEIVEPGADGVVQLETERPQGFIRLA